MRALWVVGLVWAQIKVVSGVGTAELRPGWSMERAQREAYLLAMLDALQTSFPTQVAQTSKYLLQNRTEGQSAQTTTYFFLTADQYLGVEWLETLSAKYETHVERGTVFVTCKIKGRARPREAPAIPLEVRPLRCQDTACFTLDFKDGDPFYLYVRVPISGFMQVFWEEGGRIYRLLPYQNMRLQAVPVRPDTTYLFFSMQSGSRSEAFWTDELILTAEQPEVLHRLYCLFSPNPLAAPPERYENQSGFHVVDLQAFHEWLLSERLRDEKLTLKILDISVRK